MFPRHAAIITAAGSSQRFNLSSGSNRKKEFMTLGSSSVLASSIKPFLGAPNLAAVVVTYRAGEIEATRNLLSDIDFDITFVQGGATRQQSVFNALKYLYDHKKDLDIEYVSIHDGARPFVTQELITACLQTAQELGGSCPCIRVTDTLVKVDEAGLLCGRLSREGVCTVQTPQTFRFPDIYDAHLKADPGKAYTDDTEIFMDAGGKVGFVQGDAGNRKITYASDLTEGR